MDGHIHLKFGIRCLICVGFWPLKLKNTLINALYRIYSAITMSIYGVLVISQFIEMYIIKEEDLDKISFLLGIILLYLLGLVKVWIIRGTKIKRLILKVEVTERHILNDDNEFVKNEYRLHVKKNYAVNVFLIIIGMVCSLTFCVTPVFTELMDPPKSLFEIVDNNTIIYKSRPLPIASWFPFDRYKYYKTAYAWHLVVLFVIPAYLVACDNLLLGLITFAIGQVQILQNSIKELIKMNKKRPDEVDDVIIKKELGKCVEYHRAIINYIAELSEAMRIFLMLDFAACGLQMAVIGFQAAVAKISFHLFTTIIYLLTMLTQLHMFYWFGNEILIKSQKVATAIWESDWYMCNTSTKRNLLILIMRSQKPLTLSVGPFYTVSTATMMLVLRTGYSYAAIMRRLYSN